MFDVRLWKDGVGDDNVADTIHRSKATGEPPLLLPFSVFFAIRDAVSAAGGHRVDPPLSAPATSEAILRAITAVQAETPMSELRLRDRAAAWLAAARPAVVVEVVARARLGAARRRHAHARRRRRSDRHDRRRPPRAEGDHAGAGDARRAARSHAQRAVVRARPVARPVLRRRGDARVRAARRGGAGALAGDARRCFHLQLHGAGHVGRAIATLLATLDVDVDWFDERDEGFPDATTLGSPWPAHIRRISVDTVEREVANAPAGACYLVLTHEHALDLRIAEAILRRGDFAFCGLIGSKTKRATFSRRLAERGVAAAAIARLTCPIGAPGIAGRAPEVIAVAAVAAAAARGGARGRAPRAIRSADVRDSRLPCLTVARRRCGSGALEAADPAVDEQVDAGDVRRRVGGEEEHRRGHLVGRAEALHRVARDHRRLDRRDLLGVLRRGRRSASRSAPG